MSNEVELINLTDSNGIDEFGSEQAEDLHRAGAEQPHRAAAASHAATTSAPRRRSVELRRNATANAAPQESLDAFQGEVVAAPADVFHPDMFVSTPHSAVPLESRFRAGPIALGALAGMAVVFGMVLAQRSNVDIGNRLASLISPVAESRDALPAPPPVTPASALPPIVAPPPVESTAPTAAAPEPERQAVPEPRAAVAAPAPAPPSPRLPRPLSQEPARLSSTVSAPSPSPRVRTETPVTSPSNTANVSPPASAPASATSVASAVSSPPSSAEAPAPALPPPPPAVTPPTAAAVPPSAATTAPAAASTPAPAAARPAASAAVIDANTTGVQNALSRYRRAFNSLDASAARDVWPTVNERTLSRAFERLEQQDVSFDSCQLDIQNERAEARCNGTARYVPRVGSRTPRVERREWRFSLVKSRDEWLIGAVEAR